jgi:hypothetical protein
MMKLVNMRVMWRRKGILSGLLVGCTILATLWSNAYTPTQHSRAVTLNVTGYTNQDDWFIAKVALTNMGTVAVTYSGWSSIPCGFITAQTVTGWTNVQIGPRIPGSMMVLVARSSDAFEVALPTNTLRWQCHFSLRSATRRELVKWRFRFLPARVATPVFSLFDRRLAPLSHRLPPEEQDFDSDIFEVSASVRK